MINCHLTLKVWLSSLHTTGLFPKYRHLFCILKYRSLSLPQLFLIFSLLSQLFFIFSLLSPCDIIGLVNIFPKTLGNNHPGRGKSLELWNRPYTGSGHDTLLITSAVSEMSQGEQVESVRCQDFLFDSHTGVSLDSLLHGLWVLSTREFLPSVLQDTCLSFDLKRN